MARQNILVTVEDGAKDALARIADELKQRGMNVVDVLELGGVIAGEAEDEDLSELRKVAGVSDLEIDSMFTT